MIELGVDTSHQQGQICLFKNKEVLNSITWDKSEAHSEIITTKFQDLLKAHQVTLHSIKTIYCVTGPGSFTGLRVGINFSKSISYSLNIPVVPINTLDLLALSSAKWDKPVITTIDAQRNSVFLSRFENIKNKIQRTVENKIVPIAELNEILKENHYSFGSGILRYEEFIDKTVLKKIDSSTKNILPDLKLLFTKNFLSISFEELSWEKLKPLYIRLSSAEEKLAKATP